MQEFLLSSSPEEQAALAKRAAAFTDAETAARLEAFAAQMGALDADVSQQFYVAGIDDTEAAIDVLMTIREAAIADDRETLASLIRYPLTIYNPDGSTQTYSSPEELIANFDSAVNGRTLNAMAQIQPSTLIVDSKGLMVGLGEIFLAQYDEGLKIQTINNM